MKSYPITKQEDLEKIIFSCQTCTLSMVDGDKPYSIPMNFFYKDKTVYLHSGPEGKKLEILKQNSNVCLLFMDPAQKLVYQDKIIGCSYSFEGSSVIANGKVEFVDDMTEKRSVLDDFMKFYTSNEVRYSDPSVRNVFIWRIKITEWSGKCTGQKVMRAKLP